MTDLPALDTSRLGPRPGSRIAVVGGCGSIGRGYVNACLAGGARVASIDLPASHAQNPVPASVEAIPLDATDEQAVNRAFTQLDRSWGGLDVFVHLAGITHVPPKPLEEIDSAVWDEVMGINLRSAYLTARAAMPLLRKAGGGAIVLTSSGLALNVEKGLGVYSVTKAGIIGLTKVLAKEGAPDIRANAIAPGAVETAFMSGGTGRGGEDGKRGWWHDHLGTRGIDITKTIPMGRLAVVDDVVGPMLFLSGDASRYMSGQVLHMNGGRLTP